MTVGFARSEQAGPPRAGGAFLRARFALAESAASPLAPLVIAATIPVLLFAAWIAYRSAEQQRSAALTAAVDVVDRVAERISGDISGHVEAASTLALSADLADGDLTRFYREARRVQAARPLWQTIELDDPAGHQLVNLLRPLAGDLGATADKESFAEVVKTHRAVVGGIGPVGHITGQRLISIRVPVLRDNILRFVLTVAFAPDAVTEILTQAGLPAGWVGAVVDGKGALIARSPADPGVIGRQAPDEVRMAIARSDGGGQYTGRTRDGVDVETVYRAVPQTSHWTVHVGIPREALEGPVRRSLFAVGGGVAASIALATGLAVFLSSEMNRHRRAEKLRAYEALAASEERAALAIEAAELGTWRWNVDTDVVHASARCDEWLGFGVRDDGAPTGFLAAIHLGDRTAVRRAALNCVQSGGVFQVDFRTRSEPVRWLRARGRARGGDGGREIYGVLSDIDAQKRAREERLELLRRLNDSQEETQRRIARNLHDQVGQTVTGLSIGLKGLERDLDQMAPAAAADRARAVERVRWLEALAGDIGRDIHQAAADLRPTALDDLGLPRSLMALANEWNQRHGVSADFQVVGDVRLPSGVETIIYRVVQEALTNVLKHARAQQVSIVLERRPRSVTVVIEDDGVGFDAQGEKAGAGATGCPPHLGLSSMRERLSLVHGTLRIESSPGAGTTLFCHVPLDAPQAQVQT